MTVVPVTPFAAILRRAVEATPHAIGGAFADSEGEMVDSYSTMDRHDWAVLTAHYGVVLAQLTAAFTGRPQILMEAVGEMFRIRDLATLIMRNPIPGAGGAHAAPIFRSILISAGVS